MRTAFTLLLALGLVAAVSGLATAEKEAPGSASKAEGSEMKTTDSTGKQHELEERHSRAREIGEEPYHVINFMNWRTAQIGVQILDSHEDPFYLSQARLRAEITRLDGSKETVWLKGEGYAGADYDTVAPGATVYTAHLDWIRKEPQADLKVWVPLPDGKTYTVAFNCLARDCPEETAPETHGAEEGR